MPEHYVLNKLGQYDYCIDGRRLYTMEEVAFLFDRRKKTLLSHGFFRTVNSQYTIEHRKRCLLESNESDELASDLIWFCGKFDIADINRVIDPGYAIELYDRIYPENQNVQITKFEL